MDTISEARLQLVSPELSRIIHKMADMLEVEGIVFRVTQGWRSWAEQDSLYAQGRTAPGEIVTNAKGGESWHNYGCAVDLVPMDQDPARPDWDLGHPVWQRLVQLGEVLGLYSGSEFTCIKDWPHFQLTGGFPITPNDEAKQIYTQQGAQAFWNEINT